MTLAKATLLRRLFVPNTLSSERKVLRSILN
ncbi:hypothetical protein AvCA_05210 [Azotobacter vinelandii CA]|uniref:Uncharacterized protein n=2 Tax=Azotobacter vinelandii TaxID=354 RepID=C1DJI9_AZOVD|nr:hypothetical protein Avin_05210 [Azotobacter vinelandii DJ]AGK17268.1 hypothetical protein AvCA_05210 [Azotobacter vinelandii CA]AGK19356.1 hypothetical protein AvCA6_05210 [Azotobacter vinelandii CA6]